MKQTLALAQIDIQFGNPAANRTALRPLVATAAARGADLLVLPELWSTGYDLTRSDDLACPLESGLHAELAALAREQQIALAGSTLVQGAGGVTNTLTWYGPQGSLLARYDKLHLFGPMHEPAHLQAGQHPVLLDTPLGRVGLAICYDLRFPELFRSYALAGASVLLVVAEWPAARIAHWRILAQARAIENQCFVVAVNRVGSDPDTTFGGHSLVVDPWGHVLVEGDQQAALLFATLDRAAVDEARRRITSLHDRRPDAYEHIYQAGHPGHPGHPDAANAQAAFSSQVPE